MKWWECAYRGRSDIAVEYNITHGKDQIEPGTRIKFKNDTGTYIFRCRATNSSGSCWIDCIDAKRGSCRSFSDNKLKGVVKTRRKRKSKN